ncbi:MAG: hypothetical protein ACT4O3_06980, partial [Elusimicrobiota bacterium]
MIPLRKAGVAALCLVYFATNCALAYTPEATFWAERRRHIDKSKKQQSNALRLASLAGLTGGATQTAILQGLPALDSLSSSGAPARRDLPAAFQKERASLLNALPYRYGTVRKVTLPKKTASKTVIHIQDVHLHPEAQANIGKTVRELMEKNQAGLVALEGAFGPLDLRRFKDFPHPELIREVADHLLEDRQISGAVHAALTSGSPLLPVVGIDDRAAYDANVEAYRQSAGRIEEYKGKLAALEKHLASDKARVFSPALLDFDARMAAHHAGRVSLGEHVRFLAGAAAAEPGAEVKAFLKTLAMESSLDFRRVEEERALLIERLVPALGENDVAELMRRGASYRLGQSSYGDFYAFLRGLCRAAGLDLAQFPDMEAYIQYVLSADAIRSENLLVEIDRLEDDGYRALARTPEEQRLAARSKRLQLVRKLLNFSLTAQEWKEYETLAAHKADTGNDGEGWDVSSFESFYRQAELRDEAMAANLLKAMDDAKISAAVLVTGGFHAPGLEERFHRAGAATISFVPKITKIDAEGGAKYLSVFTREKTSLDRLFEGDKLFVAPEVFPGRIQRVEFALRAVALGALRGVETASQRIYDHLAQQAASILKVEPRGDQFLIRMNFRPDGRMENVLTPTKPGRELLSSPAGPGSLLPILRERFVRYVRGGKIESEQTRFLRLPVLAAGAAMLLAGLFGLPEAAALGQKAGGLFLLTQILPFLKEHPVPSGPASKAWPWVYKSFVGAGFLFFGGFTVLSFVHLNAVLLQYLLDFYGSPFPGFLALGSAAGLLSYGAARVAGMAGHALFNLISPIPASGRSSAGPDKPARPLLPVLQDAPALPTGQLTAAVQNPFPAIMGRTLTLGELRRLFAGKYVFRVLLSGGPIMQPYMFAALKRDPAVLESVREKGGFSDKSYPEVLADPARIMDFQQVAERIASRPTGFLPLVFKPNQGRIGADIAFFEMTPDGKRVQVTLANAVEDGAPVSNTRGIRRLLQSIGEPLEDHEGRNVVRFSLDIKRPDLTQILFGIWARLSSGRWGTGPYDSGMIETKMPFLTYGGKAYETRHQFYGRLSTGETDLVKVPAHMGQGGWFARLGSSEYFSNWTGRESAQIIRWPDMYGPLYETLNMVDRESRIRFEAHIDRLIADEFSYLAERLRAAGIHHSMNVFGQFDLMWLPPEPGQSFPVPVVVESSINWADHVPLNAGHDPRGSKSSNQTNLARKEVRGQENAFIREALERGELLAVRNDQRQELLEMFRRGDFPAAARLVVGNVDQPETLLGPGDTAEKLAERVAAHLEAFGDEYRRSLTTLRGLLGSRRRLEGEGLVPSALLDDPDLRLVLIRGLAHRGVLGHGGRGTEAEGRKTIYLPLEALLEPWAGPVVREEPVFNPKIELMEHEARDLERRAHADDIPPYRWAVVRAFWDAVEHGMVDRHRRSLEAEASRLDQHR